MINGVQFVMISGNSMMLVLHADNLASHMEQVKPSVSLVVELDQFGWMTFTVVQQPLTSLTVLVGQLLGTTTVIIQKMLVQCAFQSVSQKDLVLVTTTCVNVKLLYRTG